MPYHIQIQNFQSIHDVSFGVSGFTVLVGENDIGKSSTFRAIQAVFKNRTGDDFITVGKNASQVNISYKDNQIEWKKSRKSSAEYVWNGSTYHKVVHKAPDFIQQLGFGEIDLLKGQLDPHFSKQGEGPFLFSTSGLLLTEFFSEVLKFGEVARGTLKCTADLRETQTSIKVLEQELTRSQEQLKTFDMITDIETSIERCVALQERADNIKATLASIKRCKELKQIIEYNEKITLSGIAETLPQCQTLLVNLKHVRRCIELRDALKEAPYVYASTLNTPDEFDQKITAIKNKIELLSKLKTYKKLVHQDTLAQEVKTLFKKVMAVDKEVSKFGVNKPDGLLPSIKRLNVLNKEYNRYLEIEKDMVAITKLKCVAQHTYLKNEMAANKLQVKSYTQESIQVEEQINQVFKELGFCPTCKREV